MEIVFILVSLMWCFITIKIWRKKSYPVELKSHLIALLLGLMAFNAVLGLMFLFDTIETGDTNQLIEGRLLTMIGLCISNVLFYGTFTVLFFTSSARRNQHA